MSRLTRTLLAAVLFMGLLGAPVLYLLPPDPTVQAPFVPVVLVVAVGAAYVFVYRGGVEDRHEVTGPGPDER